MTSFSMVMRRQPVYLIGFLTWIICSLLFICSIGNTHAFIALNQVHTYWLDYCFIAITYAGDGLFSIIAAIFVLLVLKKNRLFLQIILAYLISGGLAQLVKAITKLPRPKQLLDPLTYHNFIKGVTGVGWDSFPSGHTTSIFALATVLALHSKNKWLAFMLLVIAILVGYSRIYLGQHFPIDVIGGALLGVTTGCIVFRYVDWPARFSKLNKKEKKVDNQLAYPSTFAANRQ